MGLLVDVPKSGGIGTTNDGITARRFFSNEVSAAITGVDQDIIHLFSVILLTLSSHVVTLITKLSMSMVSKLQNFM